MIADRLVNELMLVSVLVAGDGAVAFAEKLEQAGAAAEILGADTPPPGFDLAILLATPDAVGDAATSREVATLAGASDRLLFAPLPLRDAQEDGAAQALPSLNEWFEMFAEHGYQPVVDFDADFVAAGAFLVDRQATAAESELAAFAERLQNPAPAAAAPREPAPPDDSVLRAERDALRAEVAALRAQIATLTEAPPPSLEEPVAQSSGWEALLPWVNAEIADPRRNTEAALRRDLPRLLDLRGPGAPPVLLQGPPPAPAKTWLSRLLRLNPVRTPQPEPPLLADIALVRASKFFDAAWYIATTPELLAGEALDPAAHYVVVGALRGADPGPWFNTTAYVDAHPQAAEHGACPLVHAIRSGEADRLMESFPA